MKIQIIIQDSTNGVAQSNRSGQKERASQGSNQGPRVTTSRRHAFYTTKPQALCLSLQQVLVRVYKPIDESVGVPRSQISNLSFSRAKRLEKSSGSRSRRSGSRGLKFEILSLHPARNLSVPFPLHRREMKLLALANRGAPRTVSSLTRASFISRSASTSHSESHSHSTQYETEEGARLVLHTPARADHFATLYRL